MNEMRWVYMVLRINQLQFLPRIYGKRVIGLGAYAQPINAFWRHERAIRLHRNEKALRVQRIDQGSIGLQGRLSTCENNKAALSIL
ncbi:hypothetical protein D3C72_1790690 [compost metagenome]